MLWVRRGRAGVSCSETSRDATTMLAHKPDTRSPPDFPVGKRFKTEPVGGASTTAPAIRQGESTGCAAQASPHHRSELTRDSVSIGADKQWHGDAHQLVIMSAPSGSISFSYSISTYTTAPRHVLGLMAAKGNTP